MAREASHMVLMADNFSMIVAAVEEGRIIYDSIRKSTRYMPSTERWLRAAVASSVFIAVECEQWWRPQGRMAGVA